MSRKQGTFGGNQSGSSQVSSLRSRRQAQKAAMDSGDRLGAGLTRDKDGRVGVNVLPKLDPDDPLFASKLIQYMQAAGLMER